jgi:hypothetical protein
MMERMEENHIAYGAVCEGRAVDWYVVLGTPEKAFDDALLIEDVRQNEHLEQGAKPYTFFGGQTAVHH